MPGHHSRRITLRRLAALVAVSSALAGCESLQTSDNFLGVLTPYRIDIVQGNAVTAEMAARVRPGMSRAQVRDLLGSPMVADAFHDNRWDYIFTFRRPGEPEQRRSVVAHFDGNTLLRLDAPALPNEREFVAAISSTKATGKGATLELSAEQKAALPPPPKTERQAPPEAPAGPARNYPPLEAP